MDIKDICGNEQAKRAMEVAFVGQLPIEFIGMSEARQLVTATVSLEITLWNGPINLSSQVYPCPCGNAGDSEKPCTCTTEDLKLHWKENRLDRPKMTVYTMRPPSETLMEFFTGRHANDSSAYVMMRVKEAQSQPWFKTMDKATLPLLEAAIKRLFLSQEDVTFLLDVSCAIARLAKDSIIKPQHLAEALQYRRKS